MMEFSALLAGGGFWPGQYQGDAQIRGLSADSRDVKADDIFVCMPSGNTDSHQFIGEAAINGASAVLAHTEEGFKSALAAGLAACFVPNEEYRFADAVWKMCKAFYGNPTHSLKVVGVTGTNGKTTTAWLVRDILAQLGARCAYLGTLGFGEETLRELPNTTPFAVDLYKMLAESRDSGVQAVAMEVSSHALDQHRVDGIEFDVAVFTNLTQDHLDYHKSMEDYEAAKFRLFSELGPASEKPFVSALNVDDPVGRKWSSKLSGRKLTFGDSNADLIGQAGAIRLDSLDLTLNFAGDCAGVRVPVGGAFNVQNCLSAAAGVLGLGYPLGDVAKSLANVRPVPGRFEPVSNARGIGVIVDYAHTPDALEKLLDSVRQLHPARIVTVFGCGGDRDPGKRPQMARAASERSDLVVLTSDNPRTEDPNAILREVESGLKSGVPSFTVADRREAIALAAERVEPGDVLVIAGKGHENYQIVGREKLPMDDREIVREALAR